VSDPRSYGGLGGTRWAVTAMTDRGLHREHNEDHLLLGDAVLGGHHAWLAYDLAFDGGGAPYLFGVADGLGGHRAGAVASRRVLETLQRRVWSLPLGLEADKLRQLLDRYARGLHEALLDEGRRHPEHDGMGTTFTGVLLYGARRYVLHAGDSRLYQFRGRRLQQVTEDHTLARRVGDPTLDASVIVNSFGGGTDVALDVAPLLASLRSFDALVLCSDGVSDVLPEADLSDLLGWGAEAARLVEEAKRRGSTDNLSAIVARVR
jgi:serine/threonine protein phosphatase PrpC